jgi:membrane-associated phospholipid phosphatase
LFGNTAADATACGIGIAAGVTTGFLRIMADRHWASDVIIGAAVGTGSAFLVYSLKVKPTRADQLGWQVVPVLRSDFLGLSFSGAFQ